MRKKKGNRGKKAEESSTVCDRGWERKTGNVKIEKQNCKRGEEKKEMLLQVLHGNFSNEKTMTVP